MRRLSTAGPVALRVAGIASLVLLLWNPAFTRRAPAGGASVVLLDASLSMSARPGLWRRAVDTARALARGGVILRFGHQVSGFDSAPPAEGTSFLAPALAAAAARGGPIVVVTDGGIEDLDAVPADLLARSRVVIVPRRNLPSAFIASVTGPHQVSPGDTVTLHVVYGREGGGGGGRSQATLSARLDGRTLVSTPATLPDSGTLTAELTLPASRFPAPGWFALDVGIQWAGDSEPRDDSRAFPVSVTSEPAAAVIGAPPDWDAKFFARTLGDVARVPVRYYTQIAAGKWNEGATLAPVPLEQVRRAVAGARLVVEIGDPARWPALPPEVPALLTWNTAGDAAGDWYLTPAGSSPLIGALALAPWDSLPPVLAAIPSLPESGSVPVLDATLSRRGQARPVVWVRETARGRRAVLNLAGLYRWDFRGGASQETYRALVAGLVDWLLAGGSGSSEWARPDSLDVANGLPVTWRWTAAGAPKDLAVTLTKGAGGAGGTVTDTLRFGADGHAVLMLAPGIYRYALADGHGRGLFVADRYSDEWHDGPTLDAQPGQAANDRIVLDWRERWWLFAIAIGAFAAEWVWRRRVGLP